MKLLLTLGHNSSAVLVGGKKIVCGYEEERLSKVKSDSSFPKLAIEECLRFCPAQQIKEIYISHWFDNFELKENKYYLPKYLASRFPYADLFTLSEEFTHHDAHAKSVWNFNGGDETGITVVADGFGNNGETLSIYRDGQLFHRNYGTSLGLMYQYTTSFLGLKENQDEYKLLGMEAHVSNEDMDSLAPIIRHYSTALLDELSFEGEPTTVEAICDNNRTKTIAMIEDALSYCSGDSSAVAYFVQSVLERVMLGILHNVYVPGDKLNFSGGVFYNVKLNNAILNQFADTSPVIEFMPVCGDQGAAMGMVELDIDTLCIGIRRQNTNIVEDKGDMVFVMRGPMEFGPRALGNTSCISTPYVENTELINKMNGRPNVMPMAPMISTDLANKYCRNIKALGKCKHYMIVATDWVGEVTDSVRGVLHNKPGNLVYTCRPQVVDNEFTERYGIVINTSLNAHGQPILFDLDDYDMMLKIHEKYS